MESTFVLWQPVLDHNQKGCYFDVQSDAFVQLKEGERNLMELFLQDLGIDAVVESWQIESFCTPYYAYSHVSHWRDQYPTAWRVYVKFVGSGQIVEPFSFQPYLSTGLDPTWKEEEDSWQWSVRNCVVIADFYSEDEVDFLRLVDQNITNRSFESISLFSLNDYFSQARFQLGAVHFPEGAARVEQFISVLKKFAPSVHWASSLRLWEQMKKIE